MMVQNTTLPTCYKFLHLYMFTSPDVPPSKATSLEDHLLVVISKLRLSLSLQNLARRLGYSVSNMSIIFQKRLVALYVKLKFFIVWPACEVLQNNFQWHWLSCNYIRMVGS